MCFVVAVNGVDKWAWLTIYLYKGLHRILSMKSKKKQLEGFVFDRQEKANYSCTSVNIE